jgi:hypothetical protein
VLVKVKKLLEKKEENGKAEEFAEKTANWLHDAATGSFFPNTSAYLRLEIIDSRASLIRIFCREANQP